GNGSEVLNALAHQGRDQILGNTAKPEPTHHEGGAILNVAYGLISAGNHFVHKQKILNRYGEEEQMKKSPRSGVITAIGAIGNPEHFYGFGFRGQVPGGSLPAALPLITKDYAHNRVLIIP